MVNISMQEGSIPSEPTEWTEEDRRSVQALREQLRHMREVMNDSEYADSLAAMANTPPGKKPRVPNRASVIDGSFMSFVFIFVFTVIVIVSFYAFKNLYHAVLKKFPTVQHTEL
ncbi:Sodium channel protein type 10 subunit alpha [Frankliniella fusca]|uniref:Sodium channel protein type 10 subunit alpha n=1 Tax=Frankliniella fusca TaxID=407009 RepID=A0AAE1HT73_9NEOP|nr:Sodium channel protein type 10 subunit alpha [Frankliniella fusca]